jgi:hypothetical protein
MTCHIKSCSGTDRRATGIVANVGHSTRLMHTHPDRRHLDVPITLPFDNKGRQAEIVVNDL